MGLASAKILCWAALSIFLNKLNKDCNQKTVMLEEHM